MRGGGDVCARFSNSLRYCSTLVTPLDGICCRLRHFRVEAIPEFEPEALLVHALAGAVQASHVMVAGRTLVRDGTIVDSVDGLYDRVRAIGTRLAGWRVR